MRSKSTYLLTALPMKVSFCLLVVVLFALPKPGFSEILQTAKLIRGIEVDGKTIRQTEKKILFRVFMARVPVDFVQDFLEPVRPSGRKVFGKLELEGGDSLYAWYRSLPDGGVAIYSHRYLKDGTRIKAKAVQAKTQLPLYKVKIYEGYTIVMALVSKGVEWHLQSTQSQGVDVEFSRGDVIITGEKLENIIARTAAGLQIGYESAPANLPPEYSGGLGGSVFVNTGITPLFNPNALYVHLEFGGNAFQSLLAQYGNAFLTRAALGFGYDHNFRLSTTLTMQLGALLLYRHVYTEYYENGNEFTELIPSAVFSLHASTVIRNFWFAGIQADLNIFPRSTDITSMGFYLRTGIYFL